MAGFQYTHPQMLNMFCSWGLNNSRESQPKHKPRFQIKATQIWEKKEPQRLNESGRKGMLHSPSLSA